jgi:hypothetical protein
MLIYFLPAIMLLGLITSYEDIKIGKIKNKYIFSAIVYTFVVYMLLMWFLSLKGGLRLDYLIDLIVNCLFAIMVGFMLWRGGTWTTGDGKLFIAYAFLVPLTEYSNGYFPFFPSMILLINSFVPFLVYALVRLTIFTTIKQKIKSIKEIELKEIGILILSLFPTSWVSREIFLMFNIPSNFFTHIFVIMILMILIRWLFPKNDNVIIIMSLVRLLLDHKYLFTFEFLEKFLLLILTFVILRFFFLSLSFEVFTKKVFIEKLKEGDIIAENIYFDKSSNKYIKKKSFQFGIFSSKDRVVGDPIIKLEPEGLIKSELKKIIELKKQKKISFKKLMIQKTLPFAPFMFGGVLITILAKGNFLIRIIEIITVIMN